MVQMLLLCNDLNSIHLFRIYDGINQKSIRRNEVGVFVAANVRTFHAVPPITFCSFGRLQLPNSVR